MHVVARDEAGSVDAMLESNGTFENPAMSERLRIYLECSVPNTAHYIRDILHSTYLSPSHSMQVVQDFHLPSW
jgi:hypothetical protein